MAAALRAEKTEKVVSKRESGLEEFIQIDLQKLRGRPSPEKRLAWNQHDSDIQTVVNDYNDYLARTPGYQTLDWLMVKAILFVETGPHNEAWTTEPMQSDNPRDPGVRYMNSQSSREDLIVPPSLRSAVEAANASAFNNIAAGVGYLLFRAAHFQRVMTAPARL